LTWVGKATRSPMSERELEELCRALPHLGAGTRSISAFMARGMREFPQSPFFPYLEAVHLMSGKRPDMFRIRHLFTEAQRLGRAQPNREGVAELLEEAEHHLMGFDLFNPFGPLGGRGIGEMFEDAFGGGGRGGFNPFGGGFNPFADLFGDDDDDDDY